MNPRIGALLLLALCLCEWPVFGFEPSSAQHTMYQIHCRHRAQYGLSPQKLDPGLCGLAQKLADAQAYHGYMAHSANLGYLENVAHGVDPSGTIAMWIGSSAHNANLLSSAEYVGFGYSGICGASLHGPAYSGADFVVTLGGGGRARRGLFRRR